MPDWDKKRAAHRREAQRNRDLAESLLRGAKGNEFQLRWSVTAAFYASVHAVESHLSARQLMSSSHRTRDDLIANGSNGVPVDVWRAHQKLKSYSEAARYLFGRFKAHEVREKVLDRRLAAVLRFASIQ